MPAEGCLKHNIEITDPKKQCTPCKDRFPKWYDKGPLFYGPDATPIPNCTHHCLKFRRRVPK